MNVYVVDDNSGGLELSHTLSMNSKNYPGPFGSVREMKWTPDGCCIMLCWSNGGGISLWSTYGTLLMSSHAWDYGLNSDMSKINPLNVVSMDWSTEGYQLIMVQQCSTEPAEEVDENEKSKPTNRIVLLDFIKSFLTVNPSMSRIPYLLFQSDDKLYLNRGDALQRMYTNNIKGNETVEVFDNDSKSPPKYKEFTFEEISKKSLSSANMLSENKHWIVITLPVQYAASNWPIRYSALDSEGNNIAVAGRTGFAIYSLITRKWKLFGNETQEKDFVVTGGIVWLRDYVLLGNYSLIDNSNEIRLYPKNAKLDNRFASVMKIDSSILLLSVYKNQIIIFTSNCHVTVFSMRTDADNSISLRKMKIYDIKNMCVHPACVVSVSLAKMNPDIKTRKNLYSDTLLLNISGKIFLLQYEDNESGVQQPSSTCLASSVECVWVSNSEKIHLKDSVWLFCGNNGMRVWLPVFPANNEEGNRNLRHTFMSKRIMLTFDLKIYPLVILFEEAIILGAENDSTLFTNDTESYFSLPFSTIERSSQVYLHQILRQLIRRNLGYNAWEIARSCTNLPYFPHSLELLLHEVLEEEATSKEPIPDALLPSVLEFIKEFPVYLQTVVQCARKTEIALWPYLFSMAGKPKELFQDCLNQNRLEIAASYLLILQNLEPSSISRQYATILLDTALNKKKWSLAKDLVRFLRAIDPNDVESPRTSTAIGGTRFSSFSSVQSSILPNQEDFSLILGNRARGRSFSSVQAPAKQALEALDDKNVVVSTVNILKSGKRLSMTVKEKSKASEEFFIEDILQRQASQLLQNLRLIDLGNMAAHTDFQLVQWLSKEKEKSAKIDDFVTALKKLHDQLEWSKAFLENDVKLKQELGGSSSLLLKDQSESGYKSSSDFNDYTMNQKGQHFSGKLFEIDANLTPKSDLNTSVTSEQVSLIWENRDTACSLDKFNFELPKIIDLKEQHASKEKNHKLEIKIRYLLQLFSEADCSELSILLSIMLLDKASVSRITNKAIRSESLILCRKLRNGLKDLTRWSLFDCLGYQKFMLSLKSDISLLDNFVIREESISPYHFPNQNVQNISDELNESRKSDKSDVSTKESTMSNALSDDERQSHESNERTRAQDENYVRSSISSNTTSSIDHHEHEDDSRCVLM